VGLTGGGVSFYRGWGSARVAVMDGDRWPNGVLATDGWGGGD
jgi:hypothetical protein